MSIIAVPVWPLMKWSPVVNFEFWPLMFSVLLVVVPIEASCVSSCTVTVAPSSTCMVPLAEPV